MKSKCKLCKHRRKRIDSEPYVSCDAFSNKEEKMRENETNTSAIWEKHFGNIPVVSLVNPNFESFMDELARTISEEDSQHTEEKNNEQKI
jgi:hypothetical protein